jgi:hypothetical protein
MRVFSTLLLASALSLSLIGYPQAMPPDPGALGKTTLAGIDSDANGLRDDAERYIALNFPDPAIQDALRQEALAIQKTIVTARDRPSAIAATSEVEDSLYCLMSRVKDREEALALYKGLRRVMLDTSERVKAYLAANGLVSGEAFPVSTRDNLSSHCTRQTASGSAQ